MKEQTNITERLNAVLLSRPQQFRVGKKNLRIYPETIGSAVLKAAYIAKLKIENEECEGVPPELEALYLASTQAEVVCTILALSCTKSMHQLLDSDFIADRAKFFLDNVKTEDRAKLLLLVMQADRAEDLFNDCGITEDHHQRERVARINKSGGSSVTFGGCTIFGQLIDAAAQRYGWTYDYIVWGVPAAALKMMLADAITSSYVSEEDRRHLHLHNPNESIYRAEEMTLEQLQAMTSE